MRHRSAIAVLVAAVGALAVALALQIASSAGAQSSAERVLIHRDTVSGGLESPEARYVSSLGYAIDLVDDEGWSALTAADFAAYRAIILGDPSCGTVPPAVVGRTAKVWGPQVDGNAVIIGTDPTWHTLNRSPPEPGAIELAQRGIDFAVADAERTGAYITLSCYYVTAEGAVVAPMLEGLSGGGFRVKSSNSKNDVHKTAAHPVLDGLSDADLSNWADSTHEGFTAWPSAFLPLAIACDPPPAGAARCQAAGDGYYTAPDGTKGLAYILARGSGVRAIRSLTLAPASSTGPVGSAHTVTATLARDGVPLAGRQVQFQITSGPHAGTTGSSVSDANGQAAFSYTGSQPGTDTIVASFSDSQGLQSSEPVTRSWEPVQEPVPPIMPPPQPPPSQELPPPSVGRTVNVTPKRGTVRVKPPGEKRFVVLAAGMQLPVGTVVDTTRGRVEIVSAANRQGRTQTGLFYSGVFKIGQTRGRTPVTTLTLRGLLPNVATDRRSGARAAPRIAAARRRRKPRRLWGDARGRFRSDGRYSAATVRGTRWLVEDHCDYTLTRVRNGSVRVRDEVRRRTVVVRRGRSYRAWAPKAVRRRCLRAARGR